ncbi:MAG: sialidase family protein [Anaerolineales bacterium]
MMTDRPHWQALGKTLLALSFILLMGPQSARAQGTRQVEGTNWSTPEKISAAIDVPVSSPRLVVDREGNPHVFWIENPAPDEDATDHLPGAIIYSRWNRFTWTTPRDILVAKSADRIHRLEVALDDSDRFHLVYVDWADKRPYYSSSDLKAAEDPRLWTKPAAIGGSSVWSIDLESHDRELYLAFSEFTAPYEIGFVLSDNGGQSWSEPSWVSNALGREEFANDVRLARDQEGVIHIAWAQYELPDGYPPARVNYSKSHDGGGSWTSKIDVHIGRYGNPNVVAGRGEYLYLAWNGASGVGGRYFRQSLNAGNSWSERTTIAPGIGGLTGAPAMAIDSSGTLHLASASASSSGIDGIAFASWDGGAWSELENASQTYDPYTTEEQRKGFEPWMAISAGNRIHLVYIGKGHSDVWYVTARTGAPAVGLEEATGLESSSLSPQPEKRSEATDGQSEDAPVSVEQAGDLRLAPRGESSPVVPIWIGGVPVLVLIGLVILVRFIQE